MTPPNNAAMVGYLNSIPTVAPEISGALFVDEVLTVSQGTWVSEGARTFADRGLRNGVPIAGATAATYTLVDADIASAISVQIVSADLWGRADFAIETVSKIVGDWWLADGVVNLGGYVRFEQTWSF